MPGSVAWSAAARRSEGEGEGEGDADGGVGEGFFWAEHAARGTPPPCTATDPPPSPRRLDWTGLRAPQPSLPLAPDAPAAPYPVAPRLGASRGGAGRGFGRSVFEMDSERRERAGRGSGGTRRRRLRGDAPAGWGAPRARRERRARGAPQ